MRRRWPLLVLLASSLAFLASLYLPWREGNNSAVGFSGVSGVLGGLDLYAGGGNADGWATEVGVAASLAALVLVAAAAVALVRPGLMGNRLPLFPVAVVVLYLGIAALVSLRAEQQLVRSIRPTGASPHPHYRYAYGAYLGIAAAAVALLSAAVLERGKLGGRPTGVEVVALALGAGLLVAFLLPWAALPAGAGKPISWPGINSPVIVLAAAGTCLLLGGLLRSGRALHAAAAIAVLVGAAVNQLASGPRVEYGAWLALGFAVALVASAAFVRPRARVAHPRLAGALAATAAGVFVVALFLPWQELCTEDGHRLGNGFGRCFVTTGWAVADPGAVAGALALVLVLAAVVAAWPAAATAELALSIAILTAAIGVAVTANPGNIGWGIGYGAYVGFTAAAILLLVALARIPVPKLDRRCVLPVAASIACLCAVAFPLWSVLPDRWDFQVDILEGWYAMAGLLLTVHLIRRWRELTTGPSSRAEELVLIPLALLALTALELVRERGNGMTWGGGILVGLCLALTLFGWLEQRGDLHELRIPEVLRIDRLAGTES